MGRRVVFLYPGQGSQEVGMGSDLYQSYPHARELFDQADGLLGFSLSRLCFEGPQEDLDFDLNAQLAVYIVSCVVTDLLKGSDAAPNVVSGYSSGFYAAAYAADCFDFEQGLRLVRQAGEILLDKGKTMDGAMAVIFGLSVGEIASICDEIGDVHVAILNTPRQTVISGTKSSVKKASNICLKKGALDAYQLPVATAYHSGFMRQSGLLFLKKIERGRFRDPKVPLFSYLSLNPVSDRHDLVKTMAEQLSGPVRWVDLVRKLYHEDTAFFVEVGPGTVISRTVAWIDRSIEIETTIPEPRLLKTIEKYRKVSAKTKLRNEDLGAHRYVCKNQNSM